MHVTASGGQPITSIKAGEDIKFKRVSGNVEGKAVVINQAGYEDCGWYYMRYHKLVTASGSDSFKIKYPSLITIEDNKYDVVFSITDRNFIGNKQRVTVSSAYPIIHINYPTSNIDDGLQTNRVDGNSEAGWKIEIYEAGTSTPAVIPNIYVRLADLDGNINGNESYYIDNFTPNTNNIYYSKDEVNKYIYTNGSAFYGTNTSPLMVDGVETGSGNAVYIAVDSLRTQGIISGYYGYIKTNDKDLAYGTSITFYVPLHTITYKSTNGVVSTNTEDVEDTNNPTGSTNTPNSNYYFSHWTVDKSVTLTDGTIIPAGGIITEAQIKQVKVIENLTFTAINKPYLNVSYQWQGDHPDVTVPTGKSNIKAGDSYTVDTTYKVGDTVKGVKNGQKGTYTFNGWDKNGNITINENTVIKGTWNFTPEYDITTTVEHGTITNSESDIPQGESRVISYTPDKGYQLKSLTVDGESKNIKDYPSSYTFSDIDADHNVNAVFELIPSLVVNKTSDKDIYNAGDIVTYTITVTQTVEGAEARDIILEDTLPTGIILTTDSITGDVEVLFAENSSYKVKIASLKDTLTYTYKATVENGVDHEELINIVNATASNVPNTTEDSAKIKSLTPKPEIEKVVSNENPIYGEEITYWIKVKEPQDGIDLRNASIKDNIPEGLTIIKDSITVDGNEATATIENNIFTASIPILSTETVFSFKAIVNATQGEIYNIAVLSGDNIEPLSDNAKITVKEPTPAIAKTVSKTYTCVGDIVSYTIEASSDIALIDAIIEDVIPTGIEIIEDSLNCSDGKVELSNDKIIFTAEKLQDTITITYDAKVTSDGNLTNKASLSAMNFPSGPLTADATVNSNYPEAIIEKVANSKELFVGETVEYIVKAKAAKGILYNAKIEDKIPEGLILDKDSIKISDTANIEIKDNNIVVNFDALSNATISYKATVENSGSFENTAILTAANLSDGPIKDIETVISKEPILNITKTASGEQFNINDNVTFKVNATVEGANNLIIKDAIPEGLTLNNNSVKSSAGDVSIENNTIIVSYNGFYTGEITLTYMATVNKTGKITNIANLSADNSKEVHASATIKGIARITSPKTGDMNALGIFVSLLLLSGLAIITIKRRLN